VVVFLCAKRRIDSVAHFVKQIATGANDDIASGTRHDETSKRNAIRHHGDLRELLSPFWISSGSAFYAATVFVLIAVSICFSVLSEKSELGFWRKFAEALDMYREPQS
jgi:hypothetical protein